MLLGCLVLSVLGVVCYLVHKLFGSSLIARKVDSIDITRFPKKYDPAAEASDFYDVVIVGAGPGGSTTAYYLAKEGKKVLLLEKKKFPRDKICGDAICKTAIEILMDMGVYGGLIREQKAYMIDYGGLVSPSGLSFVGHTHELFGEIPGAVVCKRVVLDKVISRTAQSAGAELLENSPVTDAVFDSSTGLWTISIEGSDVKHMGRVLVCADGAPSRLAMQLGIVRGTPKCVCSRAYIKGGTHRFKEDGMVFYVPSILPGYVALLRHIDDQLSYCTYILPGNPKATTTDLSYWHHRLLEEDPNISQAVGKNAELEKMKAWDLRVGGEPVTYGNHVLVVGDAAGMIDPLTGEGIHHAMDGGRIAAHFLCEAIAVGNFDKEVMKEYQNRWLKAFGNDFRWSQAICNFLYRYPIFIDATAAVAEKKGDRFLARWADIMAGRIPKISVLRPQFLLAVGFQALLLFYKKIFKGGYGKKRKVL